MTYLWSKKYVIVAMVVVWGYVLYSSITQISEKCSGYSQAILFNISKPAYIYIAVLMIISVYYTVGFKLANCYEICFKVHGRRNCGFVISLVGIHSVLSVVAIVLFEIVGIYKFGWNSFFAGLMIQRVVLSYWLAGLFVIFAGFSLAYHLGLKGTIGCTLVLLYLSSPRFYEFAIIKANSYNTMIFFQNFDFIQGHDGYGAEIDIGNMKAYKWIKIIGMIVIASVTLIMIQCKRSKKLVIGMIAVFVCCEFYYYGLHDRGLEEYMNINDDIYYQGLRESGVLDYEAYDVSSPFVIKSYDIDMKLSDIMYVKCIMKLDEADAGLDEYTFTLYHTLKVKKVTYNGKKISYKRKGDHIYLGALGDGEICIEYYGFVDDSIANKSAIVLEYTKPYYPLAGKRRLLSGSKIVNNYESDFKLMLNVDDVYTNLDEVSDRHFEGRCYGPCILKGLIREMNIDGYKVLVSKYSSYPLSDEEIYSYVKSWEDSEYKDKIRFMAFDIGHFWGKNLDEYFNGYVTSAYTIKEDEDAYDQ